MPRKTSLLAPWAFIIFSILSPSFVHAWGLQKLHGHIPKEAAFAPMVGSMDPAETLDLTISLPLQHQNELDQLIKDLYDPHSPLYRHFLTSAETTARFGPSPSDYQAVVDFATAHHLTVTHTPDNRMLVNVHGNVADIERTFHVHLNRFNRREGGEFHAPDQEPSVDLDVPLSHIGGLENARLPKPALMVKPISANSSSRPSSGTGAGGNYLGNDFRNIYLSCPSLSASTKGSGQTIALVEFDLYYSSDISLYTSAAGFSSANLTNVGIDGTNTSGSPGSGNDEVALDIEMTLCMAPSASIYVYEQTQGATADDMLNKIASDNLAKQISCSWSFSGDSGTAAIFALYAAHGQSFFEASGDDGAYVTSDPTKGVPDPIDVTANMTVVGGTTLTTSGTTYTSETTWNNSPGPSATAVTAPNAVSSGGVCDGSNASTPVPIPTYQKPFALATVGASTNNRNIPDVAWTADNIELIANNGHTFSSGGTSAAAPLWAGMTALINEEAQAAGKGTLGFLNPYLYNLASNATTYASDFHDIADGSSNNYWGTVPNQFKSTTGYDLTTGLGTPKCQLVADLAGLAPTPTNTPTITFTPTKTFTPTITFTPTNTGTPTNTSTPPSTTNSYVFPQPAHGQANFVYNSTVAQSIRIDIYNFTGQIVSSVEDTAQVSSSNRTALPLQGFAPGVYFYFIRGSSSGIIARGKFVAVP